MATGPLVTIKITRLGTIVSHAIPGTVSESKTANYDPTAIRGRSLPIYGYASSESRTVDFSLVLMASNYSGGGDIYKNGEAVWKAATTLKAACYPNYTGGIRTPPVCSLVIGSYIKVPTCIIQSTQITWGEALDVFNYPVKAEVSLSFVEVQAVPSMDTEVQERGW